VDVVAVASVGRFSLHAPRPPELEPDAFAQLGFELVKRRRTDTIDALRFSATIPRRVDAARLVAGAPAPASATLQLPGGGPSGTRCRQSGR
jgi:hypothetical protein